MSGHCTSLLADGLARHPAGAAAAPGQFPRDPIAAATHPDPYPYYAQLVAERPMYRDQSVGLWVASSAATVTAVLTSDICRVRPPLEPVPRTIAGSPAGEIFRHLVRMNDGENHCPFKRAIVATLGTIEPARLAAVAREQAKALDARFAPQRGGEGLTRFLFTLPVQVIASLLGVPEADFEDVATWVNRFVIAISPIATPGDIDAGKAAAGQLLDLFRGLFERAPDTLLGTLAAEARRVGRSDDSIIGNGVGFLSQTYEATAGLIGNTLLALAAHEAVQSAVRAEPGLLGSVIQEVLRYDPPTQSTRRFVAEEGTVAGQPMREGDAILVMLGAASRDPAANPEPNRFDIFRKDRRILNFGCGPHACPADKIAPRIAEIAVAHLLGGLDFAALEPSKSYRRSAAIRMPVFGMPA